MVIEVSSELSMKQFGEKLGQMLRGGEVIELQGDIGAGKTTLTKGIARGLEVDDDVQSPSFTISRVYEARDGLSLAHYDFYRLNDPGIMTNELEETIDDKKAITILEWSKVVEGVLPSDRLTILIEALSEDSRRLTINGLGEKSRQLEQSL